MDEKLIAMIEAELNTSISTARDFYNSTTESWRALAIAHDTKRAVLMMLEEERHFIEQIWEHGELEEKERDELLELNLSSVKKAHRHPPTGAIPTLEDHLHKVR